MIGRKPKRTPSFQKKLKGFDDFEVSLGDMMRGERATLGKSLLDVQRDLRIKAPYIVAIENSDPEVFETPGFIAGYVRSYARYLGLDPDWAFKTFCEESGFTGVHGMQPEAGSTRRDGKASGKATGKKKKIESDPLLASATALMPQREPILSQLNAGAIGSAAVLIALIGGLGYGGYSIFQEVQRVQVVPVEASPGGIIAQVDPLEAVPEPDSPSDLAELSSPSTEAFDRLYRPQALDTPVLTARDGPIASIDPNSVGIWPSAPEQPAAVVAEVEREEFDVPAPQVVMPPAPEIAIVASSAAWVRVRAADGTTLFEKILNAGERYVVPKSDEAPILRAGNSGSVYFVIDGKAFGPAGDPGAIASNVALDLRSLRASFDVADLDSDPGLAEAIAVAEVTPEGEASETETPSQ